MALRMIEVTFPQDQILKLRKVLDSFSSLDIAYDPIMENRTQVRILMPTEKTEAIMDVLEKEFSHLSEFRLILTKVEATLPRPQVVPGPKDMTHPSATSGEEAARISREELYAGINDSARLTRSYVLMVILSSIVAGIGILRDNTAVVIGAMVIAPLLGPMVALSLGTALGDMKLLRRALRTAIIGFLTALLISIGWGASMEIDVAAPSFVVRTQVGLGDLVLALASGSAGVLAFTTGAPAALVGVMVAVALLPPLVTFGLLLGCGCYSGAFGAFLVFAANVICVNLAGVLTLVFQGIRPLSWWEAGKAKTAVRNSLIIWTILLVALGLVILFARTG